MNRPSRRFPFTLIELLVVVAIIAILASILLPVLGKARAKGAIASCQGQLRQIAMGATGYAEESDSWFFPVRWTSLAAIESDTTAGNVLSYFGTLDLLTCPTHRFAGTVDTYDVGRIHVNRLYTSYRFTSSRGTHAPGSGWWYGHWNSAFSTSAASQYRPPTPSLKHLDRTVDDPDGGPSGVYVHSATEQPLAMDGTTSNVTQKWYVYSGSNPQWNNHIESEGFNVVFLDGHAQWGTLYGGTNRLIVYDGNVWMQWK